MKLKSILYTSISILTLIYILVFISDIYKYVKFSIININKPLFSFDAKTLYPYVNGNDFLLNSDYQIDDYVNSLHSYLSSIQNGDVIFVKTDFILRFFHRYFSRIDKKIILVTHNSDYSASANFKKYLNSEKLTAWFTQNPGFVHEKLIPLPIGLENTVWYPRKQLFIKSLNLSTLTAWSNRKHSIYINFNPKTNVKHRSHLADYFSSINIKNMLIVRKKINFDEYMTQIGNSKYVLCPRGNGLDTHRFYETLLMGAIPIVENSTLYPIYKQATVLVVDNFKNLDQHMLDNPHLFIQNMNFSRSILMSDTWLNKINIFRKKFSREKKKKF